MCTSIEDMGITVAMFSVDKPGPVSNFAASDITPNSVTVRWSAPLDDGGSDVEAYIVEKREGRARLWQSVARVAPDVTEAQATGLFEGNQYAFRVSAENLVGIGEPTELKDYIVPKSQFGECCILFGVIDLT